MSETPAPKIDFGEIKELLKQVPSFNEDMAEQASLRNKDLTKPLHSLGRLEELVPWVSGWQQKYPPQIKHPRVVVFAGAQGCAKYSPAQTPVAKRVANFLAGGAVSNQFCGLFESDLRVYEMALETPTQDFTTAPSLNEDSCAQALAYGMMAVEVEIDFLGLSAMGDGTELAAATLCAALFKEETDPQDWAKFSLETSDSEVTARSALLAKGLQQNKPLLNDPLGCLRTFGGNELSALVGTLIAARMACVPVILDGFESYASAAVLHQINPALIEHCLVADSAPTPACALILEKLNKVPLLSLNLSLGEGAGAALALSTIRAALVAHNACATEKEAGF